LKPIAAEERNSNQANRELKQKNNVDRIVFYQSSIVPLALAVDMIQKAFGKPDVRTEYKQGSVGPAPHLN
jgi:hypothetical protein